MNRRKRVAFGIVLGIGAGLLLSMTLTILMGRVIPSFFLLLFLLGGLIGAVIFGVAVGRMLGNTSLLPEVPWIVIVLVAIVGWPLGIFTPVGVQVLRLHSLTSQEIPIYPDGKELETSVRTLGCMELGPSISLVFRTNANAEEIGRFYQDKLSRREWEGHRWFNVGLEGRRESLTYVFEKNGRSGDGSIFINIEDPDLEKFRRVKVMYYLWRL